MRNNTIASESFSSGRKSFFLDFKLARNKSNYMRITNLVRYEDGSTRKARMYIWQEDFELWISAFASLFQSAAHASEKDVTVFDLFNQSKQMKDSGIKSWEPEKRPREKFLDSGPGEMTLAELIAMLIGSGTADANAIELGEKILNSVDNNLSKLSELSHTELAKFKGMGLAKSSAVLSALELGKRAFGFKNLLNRKTV
ncbi:hypothetical protein CA265_20435 [Sphingobacteriaceae bacterium GW460-11-11-14-LB5]|nr:hypothetical protein CA265_20435 [Sphingobacteriaceae bacterium GW460-11-11-14-LB5]